MSYMLWYSTLCMIADLHNVIELHSRFLSFAFSICDSFCYIDVQFSLLTLPTSFRSFPH
jgi:hypothetical protein